MRDRLLVCLQTVPVGYLERDDAGRLSYAYGNDVHTAISLSMPVNGTIYDDRQCEAFFGGLLPEKQRARELIARRFNADAENTFSLLRVIGHECAGAISLHDPNNPPPIQQSEKLEGEEMSEGKLAQLIRDLPRTPLLAGVEGVRLSLAGYQDKTGICLINGKICLPSENVLTTHILKPAIAEHEATVQNEFMCLAIARSLGLPTVTAEIHRAEDQSYLLVERYDRKITGDRISRVHQEDFCQALGVVTARKYEAEGGPGFKHCFDLLKQADKPALDRTTFAKFLILNYLVGNTDAHGKNFSLLHQSETSTRLAPLYDVVSIIGLYENLVQNMAMSIGDCFDSTLVSEENWRKLCKNAGFGFPAFKKLFQTSVTNIEEIVEQQRDWLAKSEFDTWVADTISHEIGRRCFRVRELFDWN
jgi:serine/threonine-protein kinase HipA